MYTGIIIGVLVSVIIFLLWYVIKEPRKQSYSNVELTMHAMLEELDQKYRELEGRLEAKARAIEEQLGKKSARPTPTRRESMDKVRQIRRLAGQGLDCQGIARQLGIGKGEVELILNLQELVEEGASTLDQGPRKP
ncbi:MAG: DUF6115 domain-containing protein [Limnochordia bacterium]|jgi:hypothetical protein